MRSRFAVLRLWLWRLAMLGGIITVLFFAIMAVAPFTTPGETVLDTVMLRARLWQDYGFTLVQLFSVGLWLIAAITAGAWRRGIMASAAGVVLFACLLAMIAEYGSLIQFDALRDPIDVAAHKLMVSRAITLGLALTSLAFGWWARPRG